MPFVSSSWTAFAGQNDVRSALHVPMIYENVEAEPVHWEYRTLRVDTREQELPDETTLNEMGQQGWLLAGLLDQRVSNAGSSVSYYFVRQQAS